MRDRSSGQTGQGPRGKGAPGSAYDTSRHRREVADHVNRRLKDTGQRALSREIGVSLGLVQNIAAGHVDFGRAWPRLWRWYVADRRTRKMGPTAVQKLMEILDDLGPMPEGERTAAVRPVLDGYVRAFQQRGAKLPDWLTELLAETPPVGS